MINNLDQKSIAEGLFDCLPDTVFFIKDNEGRYVSVNDTLVKRCGLRSKSELIGRRPSEVLGKHFGESYEHQDRRVIESGESISNKLEMHVYPNRNIGWCLTNKHALFDDQDRPIGVAGVSQDLRAQNLTDTGYEQAAAVIDYVQQNLSEAPDIQKLAAMAGLSPYQLDRRMKRIFGLTTGQWVLKQRLEFARQQLLETDVAIAIIALDAGYAEQSAFTRQFRLATGFTPSQFRKTGIVRGYKP